MFLGDERPVSQLRRTAAGICGLRVMVTAFILMEVERPRLRTIAEDLLAIAGIAEVYSVAGPYDLVAVARVREHEELNDLVTEQVAALDGIVGTETLIAFRSFSKKDLGLLWDIGS
jgi:DNA-binding Lrp family transcriptional regulator